MVMAKKIIHLNEDMLKSIIRETLNEMTNVEFQRDVDIIPKLGHTERAFTAGDILCRNVQKTAVDAEGGRIANVSGTHLNRQVMTVVFNTIVEVNNGVLILDDGTKVSTKSALIRSTDTWYRIYDSMRSRNQKEMADDSLGFTFDYEMVGGELWITVEKRFSTSNRTKTGYRYYDVKNSKPGQVLIGKPMNADPELAKSGFWIAPGTTKLNKSKNPIEGQLEVPKEFINYRLLTGLNAKAELFDSWDIEKADEICSMFPWLAEKPTDWSRPLVKGGKKYADMRKKQSKCTPSTFKF